METKHDFTQGNILKKLVLFMVPIFGALVLQAMYGAVDLIIVGWFGTTAGISAVSTGSNLVNLVVFTVTGLSMGITVLISRYIGEKKQERIGKVIGGVIWFFAILAVILTIALLLAAPVLAKLMQAPEEALELTTLYVRICGGGIVFVIAYNVISSIFRGMGNSKLPLIFVAIACVVNIVGDLVLVAGFKMNVAGAAIATILAQAVSVVLSLVIIRKQGGIFQVKREDIRFSSEVGMYLCMARVAHREGYPEIGLYWEKAAYEEAEHAAKFAEMLGEDLEPNMKATTKDNLAWRVDCEFGATAGKTDLAKCAKKNNLDAIHDTVHEMARDEARHGRALKGLLDRYFG